MAAPIITAMPWQSRIQSERTRRIVLAAVMLLVLGGSTGLAAWMTDSRRPQVAPGEPTHEFGPFSIALGAQWQELRSDESPQPQWAQFLERGQTGRQLQLIVLANPEPRAPLVAMQQAVKQLSPSTSWVSAEIEQYGNRTLLVYAGQSVGQSGDQRVPQKHALAVVTADGQTYLALLLNGFGRIDKQHVNAMWTIVSSALDTRLTLSDASPITLGSIQMERPSGISVSMETSSRHPVAWISPARPGRFYRLRIAPVDLAQVRESLARSGADNIEQTTNDQLIQFLLAQINRQLHDGKPLRKEQYRLATVEDRPVHMALLNTGSSTGMHHEAWAVKVGEAGALLIDLRAERSAAKLAQYAAQVMLAGMTLNKPGASR